MAEDRKRGVVDRINSAVDTARNIKTAASLARTAGSTAEVVSTSEIWIPIAIVIVIILIFVIIIIGTTGGGATDLGGTNPAPGGGTPGSGNISSCTFYRGGDTTQGLSFGNPQMATLVSDVSTKVGVPPAIVAGVIRVESPSAFAQIDTSYLVNDYDSTSSGIAYGIMQFTPDTFITTFNNNSSEMNTLFGKNQARTVIDSINNVFPNNFLRIYSIKDSIIATAFKIKNDKQSINGGGAWDQPTVYEIARRYYGCLRYGPGGCTSGPFNYGEDVWKSYTSCQTPIIAPAPPANIRQGLIDNFGITMDGFDNQHLQWVWEKLYELSNTKFTTLIRGTKIQKTDGLSLQIGCFGGGTSLFLGQYQPKDFFKFIFTHELGHVIQACRPQRETLFFEQRIAFFLEGGISEYARDTSRCFPGWNNNYGEDYADMIAYYVNPSAGFQSGPASCGLTPNPPNPYLNNNFPLHYNVVKDVIGGL